MECFVKKIFQNKLDEQVHSQFVRFGKGVYGKRAVLSLHKTGKIKLRGSFEYANDFVLLVAELADVKFSGIIFSREKLNLEGEKKKAGLFVYEVSDLSGEKIREIEEKTYSMLLDGESSDISLKMKKKLPKPGKGGEGKVDDKFCILEADLKCWQKIRDAFFWDVPECKKIRVEHTYIITDLIFDKNEKDFELMRINARRKGKLVRKIEADGKIFEKEMEMSV
ncbi:MAG: hypothetical protein AABX71_01925 [Nanoarchaeota archaeon]